MPQYFHPTFAMVQRVAQDEKIFDFLFTVLFRVCGLGKAAHGHRSRWLLERIADRLAANSAELVFESIHGATLAANGAKRCPAGIAVLPDRVVFGRTSGTLHGLVHLGHLYHCNCFRYRIFEFVFFVRLEQIRVGP